MAKFIPSLRKKNVENISNFIYFDQDSQDKILTIEFSKLLRGISSIENIHEIEKFILKKKRTFAKEQVTNLIIDFQAYAFKKNPDLILMYFNTKSLIDTKQAGLRPQTFKRKISQIIELVKPLAEEYIHENYEEKEDEPVVPNNEELQFTNEHNKIILVASSLMKFIVPIVTHYIHISLANEKMSKVYLEYFNLCFHVVERDDIDILGKLWKLIDSRIKATCYSDKTIWEFFSKMSIYPTTIITEFFRKIIIDIIPKLEPEKQVIYFIHVSIKNSLKFKFRYNFPIAYSPQNLNQTNPTSNNEKLTNFEKLEFHFTCVNESEYRLNKLKLNALINNILSNKTVTITAEELSYYRDNLLINNIQTNLLFYFFMKHVGKYSILYDLNFAAYVLLLVYFKKWLYKNKFFFLSDWITAQFPEELDAKGQIKRPNINSKEFISRLLESKTFINLSTNKYASVSQNIIKSNLIVKIISTVHHSSSKAVYLPSYEEYTGEEEYSENKLEKRSLNHISSEVLGFIDLI